MGWMIILTTLFGCAVKPEPMGATSTLHRAHEDQISFQKGVQRVVHPLPLAEAMARAIHYNLDHRLKTMESALAMGQTRLTGYQLLPQVALQAGYSGRSNALGSSSRSLLTGESSLEASTSSEKRYGDVDLSMTWNILDFGVSYFRARQQADRYLVAEQRRRKVIHNIIQEVRQAYWRAAVAQELLPDIETFLAEANLALEDAKKSEEALLQPPLDTLRYRMGLLETVYQIITLQRDLSVAKTQLAAMINLDLKEQFSLVIPDDATMAAPSVPYDIDLMEKMALFFRPELREEDYQKRIDVAETKLTLLQALPGLSLETGLHGSGNRFLYNQQWADGGIKLAWNLINLAAGRDTLDTAKLREETGDMRRLSLGMAILTQVHVALIRYNQTLEEYELVKTMSHTADQIQHHANEARQTMTGLDVIQAQARAIYRRMQLGLSYAELQNSAGQIYVSIGRDPLPNALESVDLKTLTATLEQVLQDWQTGTVELGTLADRRLPGSKG
ncbi:MAG: TolC family protein [Magnetococcales bacterium]|nr:TolC family protein [Magnetococcales bacterium]MBF0149281.1 TolC family protein [Magnetococcales bacterium]MBF0172814.1 TolC family protein [Magnetococcales bacterium]MBF0631613.1 TolC family protein [Magnetococcales bacterium]